MKGGAFHKMTHIEEISKMNNRASDEVLKEIFLMEKEGREDT